MSKAKAVEYRKYLKIKTEKLERMATCEFPDCWQRANEIHHMHGRSKGYMTDERYLMLICREHHNWIHSHTKAAREMKLLLI